MNDDYSYLLDYYTAGIPTLEETQMADEDLYCPFCDEPLGMITTPEGLKTICPTKGCEFNEES